MSDSLQPPGLEPTRLLCPWDFLGKNTVVSCHFLPQGSKPHPLCLLHCNWILDPLSQWESHGTPKFVASWAEEYVVQGPPKTHV